MINVQAIQERIDEHGGDRDEKHWGYEYGVLLTANEAQELIDTYMAVYAGILPLSQEHKVSTLDGYGLTFGRRRGKSTRQVDNAIQIIFSGNTCVVRDHHEYGNNRRANEDLLNRILKRLSIEHGIDKDKLKIDRNKLEISLIKNT